MRQSRPRRRYTTVRNERGGIGTGTLLLLGGAAFVLLTPQGRALIGGLGLGTGGGGIPSSLPVGTVRLANGQYRLPNGQIVGAPYPGSAPMSGSSVVPIVGAVVSSLPSIVSLFKSLFSSTAGGTGTGGATGSPGAGGSPSIPALPVGSGGVDISVGTLTLSDGSVLDISGVTPWSLEPFDLGGDLTLEGPSAGVDWWSGWASSAPPPTLEFTLDNPWAVSELGAGADLGWDVDPSLALEDFSGFSFGALPAPARVGYVPVPVRHG